MAETTYTGNDLIKAALFELGAIGIGDTPTAEQSDWAKGLLNKMINSWRNKPSMGHVRSRNVYNLAASTATYTLGDGATFDQPRPQRIIAWSVIPDDDATTVQEIPMGPPATQLEWQSVSQKAQTGARPHVMWPDWDWNTSTGYMTLSFSPVPDNGDVDVVLYTLGHLAELSSLTTDISFPPGVARLLETHLALRLSSGLGGAARVTPDLRAEAKELMADFRRMNTRNEKAQYRPEMFGHHQLGRSRSWNVYTDSYR
jgi:hypothetical protein